MREKINVIIVTLLMCLASVIIVPSDTIVQATSVIEDIGIDPEFIYNVTQNLSNVIFDAYNGSELRKGRAFGSKGEWFAKDIIYDVMLHHVRLRDV